MTYCGRCGAALAEGDEFCRQCGTPVSAVMPTRAPLAETSERRTGRIALIALAALLVVLVVAAVAYFAVFPAMRTTNQQAPVAGVSAIATSSPASADTTVTPKPDATAQAPVIPAKPTPSPTANDVTHQATYITKTGVADGGGPTLTFDYVQFLTGSAAEKAAEAHGTTADDDFYILNENPKLRTFPVSSGVVIKLPWASSPSVTRIFTFAEFKSLMAEGSATYAGKEYQWSKLVVYYVTIKNGKVTRIEQQWTP